MSSSADAPEDWREGPLPRALPRLRLRPSLAAQCRSGIAVFRHHALRARAYSTMHRNGPLERLPRFRDGRTGF